MENQKPQEKNRDAAPALAATACYAGLANMNKDERSLLLYLESRAVDHGGLVATPHMNEDDFKLAESWTRKGFIRFGRLTAASIRELSSGSSYWVMLSEEAWRLAHEERRDRNRRLYARRQWQTTEEKRAEAA